jgi:C-terminal processing protease CtpA/Prc
MKSMGLKANDVIVAINEKAFSMDDIASLMDTVQQWNENESVTLTIKRDGKTLTLKGKALFSYSESEGFMVIDSTKNRLKESWLKG